MWGDIKKYLNLKQPIAQVLLFLKLLLILTLVDLFIYEPSQTVPVLSALGLVLCTTLLWYWIAKFFMGHTGLNLLNLSISAIIVFLLVHPSTPLWLFPVTLLITFGLKSFIRFKGQPVFNPAAPGLFVTWLLTLGLQSAGVLDKTLFVSWWGADVLFTFTEESMILGILPFLLFFGLLFVANRFRKLIHASFYLGTFVMVYLAYSGSFSLELLSGLLFSSLAFLAFVMVTEPKTAPVQQTQQIVLGIVGGILLFLFYNYFPEHVPVLSFSTGDLIALLLLNLFTFAWKQYDTKKRMQKAAVGAVQQQSSSMPAVK